MKALDQDISQDEERLGTVYFDWLEAKERGDAPDDLLAAHPELRAFLGDEERLHQLTAPLREAARAAQLASITAVQPQSFGNYELLEEIGRGGMGVVYRAWQKDLRRFVALKFCRPSPLGETTSLPRFHAEAAMIAQLDHPHLVPIYEVGEHQGNVYFSMKLIEGGGLDAHLDGFRADPRASAALLVTAARAIHHAHQRAILHRDLKPSNILLDGARAPHITDFGLAKWGEADVHLTRSGTLVGTPAYMAPEQARGDNTAATTATDVYGLGAILYALLTGKAPFQESTVLETLENVKERDPVLPSRINPRTPRDLETICLKCLRKEPAQRYESAAALADDLERWQRGEPIMARPVGNVERAWRWCRRQPMKAALIAALLVAVPTGFGLVCWQWLRAEDSLAVTEILRQEAVIREAVVNENYHLAHEAVRDFSARLEGGGLLEARGMDPLRRDLLQRAQAYYKKFLERRGNDPALRLELAEVSARLAEIIRETGSPEDAMAAYQAALALYEEIARAEPDCSGPRLEQAKLHTHVAAIHDSLGKRDEAIAGLHRVQGILDDCLLRHPADIVLQAELASTYHNLAMMQANPKNALASFEKARALYEALLKTQPDNPDIEKKLANTLNSIGAALMRDNRAPAALEPLREAVERSERLAGRFPDKRMLQHAFAMHLCSRAECLQLLADSKEGMKHLVRARDILGALTREHQNVADFQMTFGRCHALIGRGWIAMNDSEKAIDSFNRARAVFRQGVDQRPKAGDPVEQLVQVLLDIAALQIVLERPEPALISYKDARTAQSNLAKIHQGSPQSLSRLAAIDHQWAVELAKLGRFDEARTRVLQAVDAQRRAVEKAESASEYRRALAGHYGLLGVVARKLGRTEESLAAIGNRVELSPDDKQGLYLAAREYAMTGQAAKNESALRQRCEDLAVETLRLAWKAGFANVERVRTDPALQQIRVRADFRELLKEWTKIPD